jgi:hypothetical protein
MPAVSTNPKSSQHRQVIHRHNDIRGFADLEEVRQEWQQKLRWPLLVRAGVECMLQGGKGQQGRAPLRYLLE